MKNINFPEWFEAEAIRYIVAFFYGEPQIEEAGQRAGNRRFIFHHEIPNQYLVAPDLKKSWLKAKRRYPDKPATGQIELFRMIEFSLRQKEEIWMTKIQAEQWRKRVLATIDKLEMLWAEVPSNFMTKVDGSQDMFRVDETKENLPGIFEFKQVIEHLEYAEPPHGRKTEGRRAEKLHFIRELSIKFHLEKGRWMHTDVAKFASTIYGVGVTASDVMRATKDLREP